MKTHVLILAHTFPKGHPSAGNFTYFGARLIQGLKKHTLRDNFESWEKKIREVQSGKAILSIRAWEDKPYRSRQFTIMNLDASSGVGIQKLHSFDDEYGYFIGDKGNVLPVPLQELANNDGLSVADWKGWFRDAGACPLAIIHFSEFRYRL